MHNDPKSVPGLDKSDDPQHVTGAQEWIAGILKDGLDIFNTGENLGHILTEDIDKINKGIQLLVGALVNERGSNLIEKLSPLATSADNLGRNDQILEKSRVATLGDTLEKAEETFFQTSKEQTKAFEYLIYDKSRGNETKEKINIETVIREGRHALDELSAVVQEANEFVDELKIISGVDAIRPPAKEVSASQLKSVERMHSMHTALYSDGIPSSIENVLRSLGIEEHLEQLSKLITRFPSSLSHVIDEKGTTDVIRQAAKSGGDQAIGNDDNKDEKTKKLVENIAKYRLAAMLSSRGINGIIDMLKIIEDIIGEFDGTAPFEVGVTGGGSLIGYAGAQALCFKIMNLILMPLQFIVKIAINFLTLLDHAIGVVNDILLYSLTVKRFDGVFDLLSKPSR